MYNLEKHLIVVLCNKKNWNRETFAQQLKEHTITWYSDAFKTKAETGIGVFVLKTKNLEPMRTYYLRNYRKQEIANLSDGQEVLRAIKSIIIDLKLAKECLEMLNKLGKKVMKKQTI